MLHSHEHITICSVQVQQQELLELRGTHFHAILATMSSKPNGNEP
jgi:hypothetical protein